MRIVVDDVNVDWSLVSHKCTRVLPVNKCAETCASASEATDEAAYVLW